MENKGALHVLQKFPQATLITKKKKTTTKEYKKVQVKKKGRRRKNPQKEIAWNYLFSFFTIIIAIIILGAIFDLFKFLFIG